MSNTRSYRMMSVLVALCLALVSLSAHAVPLKSTNGSGTAWNVDANWSGGDSLVPVSGESIQLNNAMTITDARAFGDGSEASIFSGGATKALTFGGGAVLTHVGGSTLQKLSADHQLAGTGTFANAGTIDMQANRFLLNSGGVTLNNTGTFDFTGNGAHIYMNNSGAQFINDAGGTIKINLPSGTEYARFMGGANTSKFTQNAGANSVDWQQGVYIFAPPGGIDGISTVLNDATFTSMFGAGAISGAVGDAALQLGGGLNIQLTGATDLSRVRLGSNVDGVGNGASINVTHPDGIVVGNFTGSTTSKFVVSAGNTITNVSGSKIVKDAGIDLQVTGGGDFDNAGLFQIKANRILLNSTNQTINNSGTIEFVENNAHIYMNSANQELVNKSGGTFKVTLPNGTDYARIMGGVNNAKFVHEAGANSVDWQRGNLIFAPPGGLDGTSTVLDDATFTAMFGAGAITGALGDAGLQLGGGLSIALTGATDLSRVRLGSNVDALRQGAIINVTHPDGILVGNLTGATTSLFNASSGGTITNVAGSKIVKDAAIDLQFTGNGSFENEGTFEVRQHRILINSANVEFNNRGLLHLTQNGSQLYPNNATAVFDNQADGTIRVELPADANTATIVGSGSLINAGTVEVLKGEFDVAASLASLPQFSAGSLTGGTWKVLAGTGTAILDLHPADAGIDTIGADAKVVMGGPLAQFNQLSSTTLTVDGTFGVQDQQVYNLSTGLNMGAGGILEFGLEGIDEGGTLTTGIDVDGNVTFDGSQVNILDLGGLGAGTYRIMEFISASDSASLGDTPEGFNFLLVQGADFLELDVSEIPEPSSLTLLGLGVFVLLRRSRRRKHNA